MNSFFGNELFCFVAVRITNYTTVPTVVCLPRGVSSEGGLIDTRFEEEKAFIQIQLFT